MLIIWCDGQHFEFRLSSLKKRVLFLLAVGVINLNKSFMVRFFIALKCQWYAAITCKVRNSNAFQVSSHPIKPMLPSSLTRWHQETSSRKTAKGSEWRKFCQRGDFTVSPTSILFSKKIPRIYTLNSDLIETLVIILKVKCRLWEVDMLKFRIIRMSVICHKRWPLAFLLTPRRNSGHQRLLGSLESAPSTSDLIVFTTTVSNRPINNNDERLQNDGILLLRLLTTCVCMCFSEKNSLWWNTSHVTRDLHHGESSTRVLT